MAARFRLVKYYKLPRPMNLAVDENVLRKQQLHHPSKKSMDISEKIHGSSH